MMTQNDLISAIAGEVGLSKRQVGDVLDSFRTNVTAALKRGDDIRITDFGTFKVQRSPQRQGRNPSTGEAMTIAESNKVKFKPMKAVADAVNAKR